MNASSHLSSIDDSKKYSIHSSESPQRDQAPVAHGSDLDNTPLALLPPLFRFPQSLSADPFDHLPNKLPALFLGRGWITLG